MVKLQSISVYENEMSLMPTYTLSETDRKVLGGDI